MKFKKHILLILFLCSLFLIGCSKKDKNPVEPIPPDETVRTLTIFYTNDEHGWMEPTTTHGGAAGLMGLWKQNKGYTADGPYLIISGGDMWTGPAIATYTQGEAMVDVMNAMNYAATAIGNHEFDFKVEGLNARILESNFRYLSANIRTKAANEIPSFAAPFIIKEVNGVKVGIIGLSSLTTPTSTFPDNVKDYNFIDYATALNEVMPQVKEAGAELLIIVGHICHYEMQTLAQRAALLGISLIGGGHCHEAVVDSSNGVMLIEAGSNMKYYAKVNIKFDTEGDSVISIKPSLVENVGGTSDAEIAGIVSYWQDQVDASLSEVIGYANQEINYRSWAMYNLVTDSWLHSFPLADISCTNSGGIRQSIPAGDITLATMVGVLPFENTIVELELIGSQVIEVTENLIYGGMTRLNGYFLANGTPISGPATYKFLTTDYLYSITDYNFQLYDATPYYTSVHYRQPVIDWIRSLNTSAQNPLDQYLDYNPRR